MSKTSMKDLMNRSNLPLKNPGKLTGMYRAVVEDNQDPMGLGRVRIRLPMLHGFKGEGVPTESLPWATTCGSSNGYGYGSYMVPEVGETVLTLFEDENPYKPICMGSVYGTGSKYGKTYGTDAEDDEKWDSDPKVNERPDEAKRMTPSKKILYKSPTGAEISIDEKKGAESVTITDALGQGITINTNMSTDKRKGKKAQKDSEGTGVTLKDYQGQKIVFKATKAESSITITSTDDFEFKIAPKKDGILLQASDLASIQLDKEGNITIKGKSVRIQSEEAMNIHSDENLNITSSDHISVMGESVTIGRDVTILE